MKITVKVRDIEIVVDESDNTNPSKERKATMRFPDQNRYVQETLIVMTEQAKELMQNRSIPIESKIEQ